MSFTKFEAFEQVPDTRKMYRLTKPLHWEIGAKGSGWVLSLPKGFEFDISVPRLLEWVLSPHDRRVLLAAAVHDELLNRGQDDGFASSEFRRAVIARGCPKSFAWVLFLSTLVWAIFKKRI